MRFSALVLTQDEELQVEACLRSLECASAVVIIDSGSSDRTLEIARRFPRLKIIERPFTTFADQRNYGLTHAFEEDEWVLHLDADERLTPALAAELEGLDPDPKQVAFNIPSRTFLAGRAIPRASAYPVYQTRLTRVGAFSFRQVGHGQKAPPELGVLPRLRNPYDHHPFEKGSAEWERRHLAYAAAEAEELAKGNRRWTWREATMDPIAARQWLKHASARLPGRAALVWSYLMFVRGGILDGPSGWAYCGLRWRYERMVAEALRRDRHRPGPAAS